MHEPLNSKGTVALLDANGVPAMLPSLELALEDVTLLRAYKKFLQRHGLREALFCNNCWQGQISDGCEAHVTDGDVLIKCRCRVRHYKGQTF